MVVGRYCRTISFPNLNSSRPNSKNNVATSSKSYHVRSTSLPCERTHPSIPQLKHEISLLVSWHRSKPILGTNGRLYNTTSSWLINGLTQLKTVIESLDHVLQIPFAQDSLSRSGGHPLVEKLLEHFLHFLDGFGIFHTCLLSLKQEISAAQVAIRRKDEAKVIAYVKFHKKSTKEIYKLLSAVDRPLVTIDGGDQSDEISTIIRDVLDLTTSVSAAVFESALNLLGSNRRRTYSWTGLGFAKKVKREDQNDVVEMEYQFEQTTRMLKKMQEMEESIGDLEISSGRVLRSLITTRVSLLNIITHF